MNAYELNRLYSAWAVFNQFDMNCISYDILLDPVQ